MLAPRKHLWVTLQTTFPAHPPGRGSTANQARPMKPNPMLPAGPTSVLDDLPPRAWLDTTVPGFPEGCDRFDFYAEWLARHLAGNPIPVHPRQQAFLHSAVEEPHPVRLSERVKDCLGALEIVEASHAAGETWQAFRERQHRDFLAREKQDPNWPGWVFETEWQCDDGIWEQVGEEWRERTALPELPDYPDIPYRFHLQQEIAARPGEDPEKIVREFLMAFDFSLNQPDTPTSPS